MYAPKAAEASEHGQRTIDDLVMMALMKMIRPKNYFEFGTNYGVNLYNLAMNFEQTKFYSIDTESFPFVFRGTPYENRMQIFQADSVQFDYSPYFKKMDFVFIDGGREEGVLRSDTRNAFAMLADGVTCVVWHDFSTIASVKNFLLTLPDDISIFHVKESLIAFYLQNYPCDIVDLMKRS
jgi:hypothetical protein